MVLTKRRLIQKVWKMKYIFYTFVNVYSYRPMYGIGLVSKTNLIKKNIKNTFGVFFNEYFQTFEFGFWGPKLGVLGGHLEVNLLRLCRPCAATESVKQILQSAIYSISVIENSIVDGSTLMAPGNPRMAKSYCLDGKAPSLRILSSGHVRTIAYKFVRSELRVYQVSPVIVSFWVVHGWVL